MGRSVVVPDRVFSGMRFEYKDYATSKSEAEMKKKSLKKRGFKVRVVRRHPGAYDIYTR